MIKALKKQNSNGYTIICNIQNIDNSYLSKPFGEQLDTLSAINNFKDTAKTIYFSIKRKALLPQLKRFIKDTKEYKGLTITDIYCAYADTNFCKDDSVEVFYRAI